MKIFLTMALALLFPSVVFAKADLKIEQSDVRLSHENLIAGDQVRLYASVHNVGDEDVSGYVTFYQGSNLIGASQVISVLANGSAEEVYIDFVVPSSSFNIQAQVEGTDPEDEDPSNNVTITATYHPILDDDRDGIENDADDCPAVADASQIDSDDDGEGDACDSDDDDDGLSDEVEAEIGSNPLMTDTDGDGVEDQSDSFPVDPERVEDQDVVKSTEQNENGIDQETDATVTFKDIISQVAQTIQESTAADGETDDVGAPTELSESEEEVLPIQEIAFSANAVFSYTRDSWNTFTFTLLSPDVDDQQVSWDFGDGVSSTKSVVTHTFHPGSYAVRLTLTDQQGVSSTETAQVLVPFLTLHNPIILVAVLCLSLMLLVALLALCVPFVKQRLKRRSASSQ